MRTIIEILIILIGLEHLYFLYLEMFAWTTRGPKVFKNFPKELFEPTKVLAANQGLYNGFLAAGLVWSLFIGDPAWEFRVAVFFLSCILVAGIYGALTADKKIFLAQGLLPLITLILIFIQQI